MARTQQTPLQRWDAEIAEHDAHATDDRELAQRLDEWAYFCFKYPVVHRLYGPLTRRAQHHRDQATDMIGTARRMILCPNNPRNGGPGHPPAPTFREVFSTLDVIIAGAYLTYMAILACTLLAACTSLALRTHPNLHDDPYVVLIVFQTLGLTVFALWLTSCVLHLTLDWGHWFRCSLTGWFTTMFGTRS